MIFYLQYILLSSSFIIILAVLFFVINSFYYIFKVKVPYINTPHWVIEEIIKEIKPKNNNIICELGSDDGRVIIALKRAFPYRKAIGYELAW